MDLVHKVEHRIEEVILFFVIVASIMAFANILPSEIEILKKVFDWIIMSYLIYKISPTKLLFNNKHHYSDIFIVFAFILLVIKNLVQVAFSYEGALFNNIVDYVSQNYSNIEYNSFLFGLSLIFLTSIYLAKKMRIYKPSLMDFIKTKRKNMYIDLAEKFAIIFIYLLAFFMLIFNLMMEWLTWVVDSTLVVITILFYLFIIIRHHKKYKADSLIFKIGNAGENFYKKVVLLFHSKNTILLGLTGLLVLHTLTEVNSFLIPYIFNSESFYMSQFNLNHQPLFILLKSQVVYDFMTNIQIILIYIFNYAAILFLMLFPPYLWYKLFFRSKLRFNATLRILLIISLISAFMVPTFKIKRFEDPNFVGVDIQTTSIDDTISLFAPSQFNIPFLNFVFMVLMIFLGLSIYSTIKNYKKIFSIFDHLLIYSSVIFLVYYSIVFIISNITYYAGVIPLMVHKNIIFSIMLVMFFIITLLFYIISTAYYFYKAVNTKVYKQ